MKYRRFYFAAIVGAVVTIAVAIVSCKKEDASVSNGPEKNKKEAFVCPQIDDMNAYLKEFRKKLKNGKRDEAMGIDEAAWHLACLANCDFCRVNVEYNDVQFDTVEMQVNVTDGVVLLSDLNTSYEQLCTKIQQFKKEFNLYNQNLYFINVFIDYNGSTKVMLMTSLIKASKDLEDHTWYFEDSFDAYVACDEYFTSGSTYLWYTTAKSELQHILNLYDHQENGQIGPGGTIMMCYIPTRNHTFDYTNSTDTYGSIFTNNARLFTAQSDVVVPNIELTCDEMCYCLDSYLGLGYDYIDDNLYVHERPVCWTVDTIIVPPHNQKWYIYGHQLHVEYGCPFNSTPPND